MEGVSSISVQEVAVSIHFSGIEFHRPKRRWGNSQMFQNICKAQNVHQYIKNVWFKCCGFSEIKHFSWNMGLWEKKELHAGKKRPSPSHTTTTAFYSLILLFVCVLETVERTYFWKIGKKKKKNETWDLGFTQDHQSQIQEQDWKRSRSSHDQDWKPSHPTRGQAFHFS